MADGSVEDVRRYLRYLLGATGIEEKEWFWYAEVGVFAEPMGWAPLLATHYRDKSGNPGQETWLDIAEGAEPTGWPNTYKAWTTAVDPKKSGKPILSMLDALHDQFKKSDNVINPILGLFTQSFDIDRAYADCLKKKVPGFSYLPGEDGDNDGYDNYCKVRQEQICENNKFIYPNNAIVLGLPLFVVEGKRPRLLASMIFIFEADVGDDVGDIVTRVKEIDAAVSAFSGRATRELLRRFYNIIDGFYTGDDPVTLLAHPAWTDPERMGVLQMAKDAHGVGESFRLGIGDLDADGKAPKDVSSFPKERFIFERAFKRSVEPFRNGKGGKFDYNDPVTAACWQDQRGEQFCGFLSVKSISGSGNYKKFCAAVHGWLKALYCHRAGQDGAAVAPTSKEYCLSDTHLPWLVALLQKAIGTKGSVLCWPSSLSGTNSPSDSPCKFAFPVLPGARFLIPWLAMAGYLAEKAGQADAVVVPANAVVVSANADSTSTGMQSAFSAWVQREASRSRSEPYCALLLLLQEKDDVDVDQLISGWQRCLFQAGSRRGDDTGSIGDVVACNIRSAFGARGLPVDLSCGLFHPIKTSGLLDLDVYRVEGGTNDILIGFSWPFGVH